MQTHAGTDMLGALVYFMCDNVRSMVETLTARPNDPFSATARLLP